MMRMAGQTMTMEDYVTDVTDYLRADDIVPIGTERLQIRLDYLGGTCAFDCAIAIRRYRSADDEACRKAIDAMADHRNVI